MHHHFRSVGPARGRFIDMRYLLGGLVLCGLVTSSICQPAQQATADGDVPQHFCAIYLSENQTSSFCKITCATINNTLIGFNLRPFLIDKFQKFPGDDNTQYRWDPCTALNIEDSPDCSDALSPAMCVEDSASNTWSAIGQLPPKDIVLHTETFDEGLAFSLQYTTDTMKAVIDFHCKENLVPGTINEDSEKQIPRTDYHFFVESEYACPTAITPDPRTTPPTPTTQPSSAPLPFSIGTAVLICAFGVVIMYLIVGMAYKRVAKGVTGIEAIPNISFWASTGSRVKVGGLLLARPCYHPKAGTGVVEYKKI